MKVITLILSLYINSLSASQDYVIQKNDSLSCLAESHVGTPVYGKSGSLNLLKEINNEYATSKYIYAGDVLKLPSIDESNNYASFNKDKISKNCDKNKILNKFSSNECSVLKREISSNDETHSNYGQSCKEICPHIHDNEGHAVSFLKKSKAKNENKKNEVKERYIKEAGIYQSSLEVSSKVDSTNAEWVSRENFYLKGGYQISHNNWWYGFFVEYHLLSFKDIESAVYSWDRDLPNLLKFSLTADKQLNRLGLGLSLDYNQELFFREELFDVSLEEVFILGASLNLNYELFESKSYSTTAGLKLSYPYIGSAEMDPEGELSFMAYLNLTKNSFLKKFEMNFNIYYGQKNFTTNNFDQQEQFVGLSLSLRDRVGL